MCKARKDAELAFEHLKRIMTKLKLTLNPQKTKIVDMNKENFDFLGFCYQKFVKTKSGRKALREEGIGHILKYGIAGYKKRCKVMLAEQEN